MADTVTPNYGWVKPQVGGDGSTWGATINNDLDLIDAKVFEGETTLDEVGGILTAPNEITLTAPAGQGNVVQGQTSGSLRWQVQLGDGEAETGGNAGSNFIIAAFSDTAAYLSEPLSITRSTGTINMSAVNAGSLSTPNLGATNATIANFGVTGNATVNGALTVGGAATLDSNLTVGGNLTVSGAVIQFASGWTITGNGSFLFTGAGAELAEMDVGGAFGITGQAYKPGGGSWVNSSDARIKTIERPYELGLNEILELEPVVYRFKGNDAARGKQSRTAGKQFVGLVAQEVERVFPGMVTKRKGHIDGREVDDFRDLDTSELIFALVNAVKTLAAEVAELKAR
jgi:hypothetical protein